MPSSRFIVKIFYLTIAVTISLTAQPGKILNASEIKLALKKLNILGTVLYIAAHPDDENTAVLSYFSSEKLVRTGYLSLTRGDGGQNLIGDEQGELLSVIRTQELLEARKIDGAEQFFTRAVDFGYTKTVDETFRIWGKRNILSDVVWVIRKFRPDVIITRFPTTGEGRHGQHTASAILALEAFNISGDSTFFPEQLEFADTWQTKRIYWNAWTPALNSMGIDRDTLMKINLGSYNSLLGKSYTEISAISRTMHKSQGFGASGWRADRYNYFMFMDGETADESLFDDIDLSWKRVEGSEKVSGLIQRTLREFDEERPEQIIPLLADAYNELSLLKEEHWTETKKKEIAEIIRSCSGLWLEAIVDDYSITPGSELEVTASVVNRADVPITLENIQISYQNHDSTINAELKNGHLFSVKKKITLPDTIDYTQPYWLQSDDYLGIYNIDSQKLIGLPEEEPKLKAEFNLRIFNADINFTTPLYYRRTDPVDGEIYRKLEIIPPVTVNFDGDLFLFNGAAEREITVTLKNHNNYSEGELKLITDEEWTIEPAFFNFQFNKKNEQKNFSFTVKAPEKNLVSEIKAEIRMGNSVYDRSLGEINYSHIPMQTVFPEARAKLVELNIEGNVISNVGYIIGSGDKIPGSLEDIGLNVELLDQGKIESANLSQYDAIITGIRAYNTNEWMGRVQNTLMKYVENGGTLVTQYNTLSKRYGDPGLYSLKISRDRVSEEDSPVEILQEEHQLFNFPNKITQEDFDNWVQERGLYFPEEWDKNYEPLLEMNDSGESAKRGALLFARHGKGVFIYTGLSFFRQLPAGVQGAYRLFLNMISAGQYGK